VRDDTLEPGEGQWGCGYEITRDILLGNRFHHYRLYHNVVDYGYKIGLILFYKMRTNPIKLSLVIATIAMLILLAMAIPVFATNTISKINDDCASNIASTQLSIPSCCITQDCSFDHCNLSSANDEVALLHSRPVTNCIASYDLIVEDVSVELNFVSRQSTKTYHQELIPSHISSEYHCRNSLDSEEPY